MWNSENQGEQKVSENGFVTVNEGSLEAHKNKNGITAVGPRFNQKNHIFQNRRNWSN